jgi:hypothetical protein
MAEAENDDSYLTDEERARMVSLLRQTYDQVVAAVQPLNASQWGFRPGLDSWSVGLIIEHLGVVETRLFAQVDRALKTEPNRSWFLHTHGKDDLIVRLLADRSDKRDAPPAVVPTGNVDRGVALRVFRERRAQSIAFTETTTEPLKAHTLDHHRAEVGTINAYQWLLYIPLHTRRHLNQIREIQTVLEYPR